MELQLHRESHALARLHRSTRRLLDERGIRLAGRNVQVLVSGGVDSVVALALLASLPAGQRPAHLLALHLDHGLRDARPDARAARDVCARVGVPLVELAAPAGLLAGSNLHDRARTWRLGVATQVALERGCDTVATGHHADDQLETVLGALVDDGAPGGLAAMPVLRELAPGVALLRPLLATTRAEIVAVARDLGLDWVEDAGNRDERFARARVRERVIPELLAARPGGAAALLRTTAAIGSTAVAARQLAAALLDAHAPAAAAGAGTVAALELAPFHHLDPAARSAVVAEWLRRNGLGRGLSSRVVGAVAALFDAPVGSQVDLRRACACRGRYHLDFRPSEAAPPEAHHRSSS